MTQLQVCLRNTNPMRLQAEFDCSAGELIALVGPSGSGKTSLLRALAGLLTTRTLRGSVKVGGQPWFDSENQINLSAQQRRVGLVFQSYALFPHLSALDNVLLGGASTRPTGAYLRQAQTLLERLGMEGLLQRRPAQLSGGQQQRVALARALMRVVDTEGRLSQPGILLLDEPFSAVDAPTRQALYRELAAVRQSVSVPMVLVTHDLNEARKLADRMVLLDQGETLQTGTPTQLFSSPRNARVAQLLGIQNHFKGRFYQDKPGWGSLQWGDESSADSGFRLQVIDKNRLQDGAQVSWVLAGEAVDIEADSNEPMTGNCLVCVLQEVLVLGETSLCVLRAQQPADQSLTLSVSTALLRDLGARQGSRLRLHLAPHGIHIMPARM